MGRRPASEIQKLARDAGHTPKSIRSARAALGVKPTKAGFDGGWVWALPGHEDALTRRRCPLPEQGTFGPRGHLGRAGPRCMVAIF